MHVEPCPLCAGTGELDIGKRWPDECPCLEGPVPANRIERINAALSAIEFAAARWEETKEKGGYRSKEAALSAPLEVYRAAVRGKCLECGDPHDGPGDLCCECDWQAHRAFPPARYYGD